MVTPGTGRWYEIANAAEVPSPSLVFYPDRIEDNIRLMIRIAGGAARLRPHVKTHKTAEIVAMQVAHGIRAFKCATIAEAEMTAAAGAQDVLLAMQPVGPAVPRFLALSRAFPACRFAAIVDDGGAVDAIAQAAAAAGVVARLWLDVNSGMNRTGVAPGDEAGRLYDRLCATPHVEPGGLHVYDGHIHEADPEARAARCDREFAPVEAFIAGLRGRGLPVPAVVAGGSPTFPVHARRPEVELSPGTPLLWDAGYGATCADLEFLPAALVLTRVVSKPAPGLVSLDVGTKAVADEMPQPRIALLDAGAYRIVGHNEEHLVVEMPNAERQRVGDVYYGVPTHICPTVARYDAASIVRGGRCVGEWAIAARRRRITI